MDPISDQLSGFGINTPLVLIITVIYNITTIYISYLHSTLYSTIFVAFYILL